APWLRPLKQTYGFSRGALCLDNSLLDLLAYAQFFVLTAHRLQQKPTPAFGELLWLPQFESRGVARARLSQPVLSAPSVRGHHLFRQRHPAKALRCPPTDSFQCPEFTLTIYRYVIFL